MSSEDIKNLTNAIESSSNIFTIPESVRIMANIAEKKGKCPSDTVIIKGFLAGVFIAFGGYLSLVIGGNIRAWQSDHEGLVRLLIGAVFPIGVILLVLVGTDLFTGNTLILTIGWFMKKKIRPHKYAPYVHLHNVLRVYVLCYLGNAVGALFVAFFFVFLVVGNPPGAPNEMWVEYLVKFTDSKITESWYKLILSGIAANWLLCLALYIAVRSKTTIGKIVGIWAPVFAFVAMGFDQSIANCFFLPLGYFYGAKNVLLIFYNLILVTIGNIFGGSFFVAAILFYNYKRSGDWKDKMRELYETLKSRGLRGALKRDKQKSEMFEMKDSDKPLMQTEVSVDSDTTGTSETEVMSSRSEDSENTMTETEDSDSASEILSESTSQSETEDDDEQLGTIMEKYDGGKV